MALTDMKGWRVGQAVGSTMFPEQSITQLDGFHEWPDAELVGGVAGCTISLYADDPTGAYVMAVGPDRDAVVAACGRAAELVRAGTLAPVLTGGQP